MLVAWRQEASSALAGKGAVQGGQQPTGELVAGAGCRHWPPIAGASWARAIESNPISPGTG